MVDIFKTGSMITTFLGLSGLVVVVLFYTIRTVHKGTNSLKLKQNTLKYIVVFSSLCLTYSFIYYLVKELKSESNHAELGGIVFADGKVKDGVKVSILELEKSAITNEYGIFRITFDQKDSLAHYSIKLFDQALNIDTLITVTGNPSFSKYFLQSKTKKPIPNTQPARTFQLNINGLTTLEELIKNDGLLLSSNQPTYTIKIGFTGSIEPVDNNLYRYNGGKIIIKVNEKYCSSFGDLIVKPTFSGGNNMWTVQSTLNKQIMQLISDNQQYVYQKIRGCIH